jgi:hypothetical protein
MARKAADIVAVKVRMRKDLRRQIEKLARKNDQSVNAQTVLLLESAVLAEQSGVSGIGGVLKVVQSSTANTQPARIAEYVRQSNKGGAGGDGLLQAT